MRILVFITFYQNALQLTRVQCASFYQSALHREQREDITPSFGRRGFQWETFNSGYVLLWFTCKTMWRRSCLPFTTLTLVFRVNLRDLNFTLSISFLSSLASVVEFLILYEEKSLLLKLVEWLKQTKTVVHRDNFIYAGIYSFHPNMNLS